MYNQFCLNKIQIKLSIVGNSQLFILHWVIHTPYPQTSLILFFLIKKILSFFSLSCMILGGLYETVSASEIRRSDGTHYSCRYCGIHFSSAGYLVSHKTRFCHVNPSSLRNKYNKNKHRNYRCAKCGMLFASSNAVTVHVQKDCGKLHKCRDCHKIFSTSATRNIHKCKAKVESVVVVDEALIKCEMPDDNETDPLA